MALFTLTTRYLELFSILLVSAILSSSKYESAGIRVVMSYIHTWQTKRRKCYYNQRGHLWGPWAQVKLCSHQRKWGRLFLFKCCVVGQDIPHWREAGSKRLHHFFGRDFFPFGSYFSGTLLSCGQPFTKAYGLNFLYLFPFVRICDCPLKRARK